MKRATRERGEYERRVRRKERKERERDGARQDDGWEAARSGRRGKRVQGARREEAEPDGERAGGA